MYETTCKPPWISVALLWWVFGNQKSEHLWIQTKRFQHYCSKFLSAQIDARLALRKPINPKISSKIEGKIDCSTGPIAVAAAKMCCGRIS